MVLVIDNYDSFTYNLVQYLGELGAEPKVVRNDEVTLEEIAIMAPSHILISPGPGVPANAGISVDVVLSFARSTPILGVCLGHQAIGEAFGGAVVRAPYLMHGKTSEICHDGNSVFAGLPYRFTATRYHSLVVDRNSVPDCLEVSATTPDGIIMGLRHRQHPCEGVQFHPESIMTPHGKHLLENFLRKTGSGNLG
ncbi:MAG TPA: aminodeoxychorismate/anthranilate synthase component II [Blastocatellia bacterium]|nr:aminodeoxychorismate/anthranilate synthase component II [Blastocatellia bacterium]